MLFVSYKNNKNFNVGNEYESTSVDFVKDEHFYYIPIVTRYFIKAYHADAKCKKRVYCNSLVKMSADLNCFTYPITSSAPPTFYQVMNFFSHDFIPEKFLALECQECIWNRFWKSLQKKCSISQHIYIKKLVNRITHYVPNKVIAHKNLITHTTIINNSNAAVCLFRIIPHYSKITTSTFYSLYIPDQIKKTIKLKRKGTIWSDNVTTIIFLYVRSINRKGKGFSLTVDENLSLKKFSLNCCTLSSSPLNFIHKKSLYSISFNKYIYNNNFHLNIQDFQTIKLNF